MEAARGAEQAGFEPVWATEFADRSATVAMAAMAAATERITIGSAIAYAFGRTPLILAAEARDLDADDADEARRNAAAIDTNRA